MNGNGTLIYSDGNRYEGGCKDDYRHGKGNPPSASKMLRRYGFKDKRKDKLIRAAEQYLRMVEVL